MITLAKKHVFTIRVLENHNVKDFEKQRIEENLVRNLTPIFQVARIFGISPHLNGNTKFILSKYILVYSIIYFIFHAHIFAARTYLINTSNWDAKLKNLIYARMLAFFISGIIDMIVSVSCDRNLQDSLYHLKLYDMTMKFETDKNNSFVKWSWIVIIMNIVMCLSIAGVSYRAEKEHIFTALYFFFTFLRFSLGILKFLALIISIAIRFRHLNLGLMKGVYIRLN